MAPEAVGSSPTTLPTNSLTLVTKNPEKRTSVRLTILEGWLFQLIRGKVRTTDDWAGYQEMALFNGSAQTRAKCVHVNLASQDPESILISFAFESNQKLQLISPDLRLFVLS